MAIANPSSDITMSMAAASDLLLNKDGADLNYINRMAAIAERKANEPVMVPAPGQAPQNEKFSQAKQRRNPGIQSGNERQPKHILDDVKAALAEGKEPGTIINDELIPAINEVGALFEKKIYFLPQLISSAETMKTAIEYLEPLLSGGDDEGPKVTIVIATVEGDIHDIGKNLVTLMLKNYGFRVIDLGKDVRRRIS